MEGPRTARKEELQEVINLVNLVFRTSGNLNPTMGQEFPLLLGENNLDNMWVILEDGKVVSNINYYPTTISIENTKVKVASIGAVCTNPNFRGKGYASTILDNLELKVVNEGAEIMLVSGGRGLYRRKNCVDAGGFCKANLIPNTKVNGSITLSEINDDNIDEAIRIYNKEPIRFNRIYNEFKGFHKGVMTPWGNMFFKSYLINFNSKPIAYIVVRFFVDSKRAEIREFAGDRASIIHGIYHLIKNKNLDKCTLTFHCNDVIKQCLEDYGVELKQVNQAGTVKILNFTSLMNSLKPYMEQYIPMETLQDLRFKEIDEKYFINLGNEQLEISNMGDLAQLIFGQTQEDKNQFIQIKNKLSSMPRLKKTLEIIFPIAFPWTDNMNFI